MLTLTPSGLETSAERAFFSELTSWDSGGAVRGAVVAGLPLSDGPMDRRVSDAVVFVPEGLAVVRIVEVVRQSGVVTVLPEGAWTIGPGAGPGDVLRLAGGGSTTLDGLMRAGMEAAVRLRRVGLEPGRIARLTVLSGELTGLVPADGDLGEGDQVALLEPRSLLLGIARASRYAGTDNPRLWTTADVRAALDALGVGGRSPSVEELNGEGFPYSPYVLRRRELLAPATLANQPAVRTAAPTAAPVTQSPVPPPDFPATGPGSSGAPVGGPGGPLVDPAAAGALAAAAVAAQDAEVRRREQPSSAQGPLPEVLTTPTRDTVALLGHTEQAGATHQPTTQQPTAPRPTDPQHTQQIRPAAPLRQEPPTQTPPAWAPAQAWSDPSPPAWEDAAPPARQPDQTGGLGGFFAETGPGPATSRGSGPTPPTAWTPTAAATPAEGAVAPAAPRRRGLLVVLAALALVVVLGLGGWLLTRDGEDPAGGGTDTAAQTTSAAPTTSEPAVPTGQAIGTTQVVAGTTYTLQAFQYDASCAGRAYGAARGFFETTDCGGLVRSLWSAEADGLPAVVSVAQVTMPDAARAQALLSLTDTAGTGNVNDLLREGVRFDGGPEALSDAEYASAATGEVATIVETDWVDGEGSAAALLALAENALELSAE